jgi:hypothetical protein
LALFALVIAGCGKKKSAPTDSVPIDQPHPPDLAPGTTLLATLERTGCYGECPVYRLTVSTDGSVVYVGTRWVKVTGRHEFKLTPAQVTELESAFERANFMSLHDYDHVESTDDDWAHLSLQRGGRIKRVRHYHGDNSAPAALSALEDEFDHLTDSGRFVGISVASGAGSAVPIPAPSSSGAFELAKPPTAGKRAPSAKPGESAGPPDEAPADPDNHP